MTLGPNDPTNSPNFAGVFLLGIGFVRPDAATLERQEAHWKSQIHHGIATFLNGPTTWINGQPVTGLDMASDATTMLVGFPEDPDRDDLTLRLNAFFAKAGKLGPGDPAVRAEAQSFLDELSEFSDFDFFAEG